MVLTVETRVRCGDPLPLPLSVVTSRWCVVPRRVAAPGSRVETSSSPAPACPAPPPLPCRVPRRPPRALTKHWPPYNAMKTPRGACARRGNTERREPPREPSREPKYRAIRSRVQRKDAECAADRTHTRRAESNASCVAVPARLAGRRCGTLRAILAHRELPLGALLQRPTPSAAAARSLTACASPRARPDERRRTPEASIGARGSGTRRRAHKHLVHSDA